MQGTPGEESALNATQDELSLLRFSSGSLSPNTSSAHSPNASLALSSSSPQVSSSFSTAQEGVESDRKAGTGEAGLQDGSLQTR